MEFPEETLPAGLTWPRFRAAYSALRRGASTVEVSRAWRRYKALQPPTSARVPTRHASPKTSPKRSPVRHGRTRSPPLREKGLLEQLPPDVKRYLVGVDPAIVIPLQRVSRTVHRDTRSAYSTLCDLPVSVRELSMLLDRRMRYLELHPKAHYQYVRVDIYPTREYMVAIDVGAVQQRMLLWRSELVVELFRDRLRLRYTHSGTRSVALPPANFRELGWEFAKYLVLDVFKQLLTDPDMGWDGVETRDYLVVMDRTSSYDVYLHRRQCVEANPSYALQRSEDQLMEAWERRSAMLRAQGVADRERAEHLGRLMERYLVGFSLPAVGIRFTDILDEEKTRLDVRERVPSPLDPRVDIPRPLKPCDETLSRDLLERYGRYLLVRNYRGLEWLYRVGDEWRYKVFMVYVNPKDHTRWFMPYTQALMPSPSRILKGPVLVEDTVDRLPGGQMRLYTVEQMVDEYRSSDDAILSVSNLYDVLHAQEGCVQRDLHYVDTKVTSLVTAALNTLLGDYDLTVDALLRNVDDEDYFRPFYGRGVTLRAYNLVSKLSFFVRNGLVYHHVTTRGVTILEKMAPYKTFQAVAEWTMEQLASFYAER
jgi:hypothetical protein